MVGRRGGTIRWLSTALAVLLLALGPAHALNRSTPESDASVESRVEVIVVGSSVALETIRDTMGRYGFGVAQTTWRTARRLERQELLATEDPGPSVVRCWIDLSEPRRAHLYFANRRTERFLVRKVALPQGLDEVGREALGQVLEFSVAALLEDAHAGLTRAEAQQVLAASEPPPAESAPAPGPDEPASEASSSDSLAASGFYAAKWYSTEIPVVHGPGIALAWVMDTGAMQTSVAFSGQYEWTRTFTTDTVGVELANTALRGGIEIHDREGFGTFGIRLGAGVDLTQVSPRKGSSGSSIELSSSRLSPSFVLNAGLGLGLSLGSHLAATLHLFADVHPTRAHYDVRVESTQTRVVSPWRVRPGLAIGLTLR